jgi:hypothetical protein
MLDAYAVRKAIPRVVLAVIAINLSIYICVAALDITTIIGRGLNQLIVSPFLDENSFKGIQIENNVENNILGVLGVGGVMAGIIGSIWVLGAGAAALGILGVLLPLIITVGLIALAVLFTLVIRQGLIIFLTVVSPIAFVCYVLPGTEKYFKKWADLFVRTLLVYPIIAAIFAMSNVLGAILLSGASGTGSMLSNPGAMLNIQTIFGQSNNTPDSIGVVQLIVAVLVLYAPLVLIPFAFKLAGGAISAVMNAASGRAANLAGRAGQSFNKYRKDPDSVFGRKQLEARTRRAERGLTAKGVSARFARGRENRANRLSAARTFDTARVIKANSESMDYAAIKDDSDATTNLALYGTTAASHAAIDKKYRENLEKVNNGEMFQAEADRIRANDLRASAVADKFRGNNNFRRMALMEAGTIKYGLDPGVEGWKQATDAMQEISGGDAGQYTNMMNQFQWMAPRAERADLSGSVGGDSTYNPTRGWKKQSLYEAANASPDAMRAHVEAAKMMLESDDEDTRRQGAVMVEEFRAILPSAKGGVADIINKELGTKGSGGLIDLQAKHYDMASTIHGQSVEERTIHYEEEVPMMDASGNPTGETIIQKKTRTQKVAVSGGDKERSTVTGAARTYERPNPNNLEPHSGPGNPPDAPAN